MADTATVIKPKASVLSDVQIKKFHTATLDLLERTDISVQHPKALEILAGAGARVEKDRIYLPAHGIERPQFGHR